MKLGLSHESFWIVFDTAFFFFFKTILSVRPASDKYSSCDSQVLSPWVMYSYFCWTE